MIRAPHVRALCTFALSLGVAVTSPIVAQADLVPPKPTAASAPKATAASKATNAPKVAPSAPSSPSATARDPNLPQDELPPGHPDMRGMQAGGPGGGMGEGEGADAPQGPHGAHGHGGGGMPDENAIPPDTSQVDARLPTGTIAVAIVDAKGTPMPGVDVVLGMVENSIAKGETRKRLAAKSGPDGFARWDGLQSGSAVAYRVSVQRDAATFALMPFRLAEQGGQRGILHVLPVVHTLDQALVVMQTGLYFELKDDRVQFEQAIAIYNFGQTAWVPDNLTVELPKGMTAFTTQAQMSDVGVDPTPTGYRLRGTITPGRHDVQFRFQLPYDADPELKFQLGLPPHMALARVVSGTTGPAKLVVEGFPEAVEQSDGQGQKARITEKEARREDPPLTKIDVALTGIPETGLPKNLRKLLTFGMVGVLFFVAVYLTAKKLTQDPRDQDRSDRAKASQERADVLSELAELERARAQGDVGPKTYEKARDELMAALARTFA